MLDDNRIDNETKHRLGKFRRHSSLVRELPDPFHLERLALGVSRSQSFGPLQFADSPRDSESIRQEFDELRVELIDFASKIFKIGHGFLPMLRFTRTVRDGHVLALSPRCGSHSTSRV